MSATLPKNLQTYFWDVNKKGLITDKNRQFVVQRLLDKGNDNAVSWVLKNYDSSTIKDVIKTNRGFSPKIARFWALYFKIPEKNIVCLQTPYLKRRLSHWPY